MLTIWMLLLHFAWTHPFFFFFLASSASKTIFCTFPHHRYIPDWFFSKKTSLELSEVARAGTSIALVLDGSEPWIWNNLIGGSGSVDPFLDVPPWYKMKRLITRGPHVMTILWKSVQECNCSVAPQKWPFSPWKWTWSVLVLCPLLLWLALAHHCAAGPNAQPERLKQPLHPESHGDP